MLVHVRKHSIIRIYKPGSKLHYALITNANLCCFDAHVDANKTGVAQETVKNVFRSSGAMTEQEARQVLGITEHSSWDEIMQVDDLILHYFMLYLFIIDHLF